MKRYLLINQIWNLIRLEIPKAISVFLMFLFQTTKCIKDLLHCFASTSLLFLLVCYSFDCYGQSGPNCPSVCYGPGGAITNGSLDITSNAYYSSITVANNKSLTVRAGVTLYVGQVGTGVNNLVVDFQNGSTVIFQL